ncbi:MAG: hypothetical protein FMNOHCHN_03951 [Ignavibacteriaceae bacterium]|nr:hypothetical protein [Ignavibacteriaceae bacterium]
MKGVSDAELFTLPYNIYRSCVFGVKTSSPALLLEKEKGAGIQTRSGDILRSVIYSSTPIRQGQVATCPYGNSQIPKPVHCSLL